MAADLVRVVLVDTRAPQAVVDGCRAVLDPVERARAEGIRSPDGRRRYVVAHGALRTVAGQRLGLRADEVVWTYGEHGKPAVAGLHVNLSHSGEFALLATCTTRPVGVDVQQILPGLDATAMARRFFHPDEAAGIAAAGPDRWHAAFAELWARKEALVKAAGGRLTGGLAVPVRGPAPLVVTWPGGGPYRLTDLPAPDGYRAAVALAGAEPYRVIEPATEPPDVAWPATGQRGLTEPAAGRSGISGPAPLPPPRSAAPEPAAPPR